MQPDARLAEVFVDLTEALGTRAGLADAPTNASRLGIGQR